MFGWEFGWFWIHHCFVGNLVGLVGLAYHCLVGNLVGLADHWLAGNLVGLIGLAEHCLVEICLVWLVLLIIVWEFGWFGLVWLIIVWLGIWLVWLVWLNIVWLGIWLVWLADHCLVGNLVGLYT